MADEEKAKAGNPKGDSPLGRLFRSSKPSGAGEDGTARHAVAFRVFLFILLAGLSLRVLYLVEQPSFPYFFNPEVDSWLYDRAARLMAAGDWSLGSEPLRRSPGYYYLLGSIYALFGTGPWAPRIVQILLGLTTVYLIWDIARRMFGERWALLSAAAAALYGPYIYFEGFLLSATPGIFCHALLLWLGTRAFRARDLRPRVWALIGLAWGVCTLVRPNALLLLAPLALACFLVDADAPRRRRLTALGCLLLFGALAIAPVTLRNLRASGEFILIASHGGQNLYKGNCPGATGTWHLPREIPSSGGPKEDDKAFHRFAERDLGRPLSFREADSYWYRRTLRVMLSDPVAWLGLMARKLHLFWNGRELHNIYDYEFMRVVGVVLGLPLVQFAHIAPFGLLGSLVLLARRREHLFLALFNWTTCAGVVLFFVTDRYRVVSVAGIILAGTALLQHLRQLVARSAWRALAAHVAGLALAVAIAVPVEVNKRLEEKYHHLADSWSGLGHHHFAEWAYLRSLQAKPDFIPSRLGLARLYERQGRLESALRELRAAARIAERTGDRALLDRTRSEMKRVKDLAASSRGPSSKNKIQ